MGRCPVCSPDLTLGGGSGPQRQRQRQRAQPRTAASSGSRQQAAASPGQHHAACPARCPPAAADCWLAPLPCGFLSRAPSAAAPSGAPAPAARTPRGPLGLGPPSPGYEQQCCRRLHHICKSGAPPPPPPPASSPRLGHPWRPGPGLALPSSCLHRVPRGAPSPHDLNCACTCAIKQPIPDRARVAIN